jgi:hypothetical protein
MTARALTGRRYCTPAQDEMRHTIELRSRFKLQASLKEGSGRSMQSNRAFAIPHPLFQPRADEGLMHPRLPDAQPTLPR